MARPVHDALRRQFDALFAMLEAGIVQCPDATWLDETHGPAGWRLAFHTLHFTDAYLSKGWDDHELAGFAEQGAFLFEPWTKPDGAVFPVPDVTYDKPTLRGYLAEVQAKAGRVIDALDLDEPSPFTHIDGTRVDVLIYNLRHAAHHAGQLALLARRAGGGVVKWSRNGESHVS
ncbi:MAG: DinB family protein [Planctomycetota bacterium]